MKDRRWALLAGLIVLGAVALRAWVCDDAAITARCVDNLLSGHGLRWNVVERVAPFTHPLWALLQIPVTAAFGWYAALIGLGIACTGVALWLLLVRIPAPTSWRLVVAAALWTSMGFLDFSTSGLENSLTHALLVACVLVLPRTETVHRPLALLVLAGFVVLNRLDAILLVGPVVTVAVVAARRRGASLWALLAAAAIGALPLLAWEAFSLAYYGFVLPNTAYAKLNTGVPLGARLTMGLDYALFSLKYDPVLLPAQVGFVVVLLRRRAAWDRAIAAGVILYDVYVLWIGGDFMGGRFWTAPLVLAGAGVLRGAETGLDRRWTVGLMVAMAVGFGSGRVMRQFREVDYASVVDERASFLGYTAIRGASGPNFLEHPWQVKGRRWRRQGPLARGLYHGHALGFLGLEAGPEIFIVGRLGLTDPLVARLPAAEETDGWRAGHFERMGLWSRSVQLDGPCPKQYETCRFWRQYDRTLRVKRCMLDDPDLCTYWNELQLITRGELWSAPRWRAIAAHNLGLRTGLIDKQRYRTAALRDVDAGRFEMNPRR